VLPVVASYYGLISRIKLEEMMGWDRTDEHWQPLWDNLHEQGAAKVADTVTDLKGFYVKTAQIISTRQDLFPKQYTDALSDFTDNVDPMPVSLVKAVIQKELLRREERFEDVFVEFDDEPLGAASVAQVHRARLAERYGGREVAVKVQRPSIESKLMGDIANLKALTKTFRSSSSLPLDYYTVMCELEKQLAEEFDFVAEAVAMDRIYNSLTRAPDGSARDLPLVIPRPVSGLVSQRVLVMDYLRGVPLSRAREEMERRGIDPNSPEAKLFGRNLLSALTTVFGRTILETGFFHADPHPGNIFVLDDGQIGLIDFGQVKQISGRTRETLCKVMVALDERRDDHPEDQELVGKLALELGVELQDFAKREAAAAIGIWLFDGSVEELPGGYDKGELDPNSPVKELKSFPQDLVLVGRASILIKALSNRLNVPWSLAKSWAPTARQVMENNYKIADPAKGSRVRFRQVWRLFKQWGRDRATFVVRRLPSPVRNRIAKVIVRFQDGRIRRKLMKRDG
jgi:aarF domain-containing kinase